MIEFRCERCTARYCLLDDTAGTTIQCERCGEMLEIPFPPLELPQEVTPGGSVVYRHEEGSRNPQLAMGNEGNIDQIVRHIEQQIGSVDRVLHEVVSDVIHVDVHCVGPTESRAFHTLVTSGMSDRPMATPPDETDAAYAELMLSMPPDWPLTQAALTDNRFSWPIQWLKMLARFPHEYDTWLSDGHTVPNGDPPEPFAENTDFCGWLLLPATLLSPAVRELELEDARTIRFFSIYPLYRGELEMKLNEGVDALIKRFERASVTEVLDPNRPDATLA